MRSLGGKPASWNEDILSHRGLSQGSADLRLGLTFCFLHFATGQQALKIMQLFLFFAVPHIPDAYTILHASQFHGWRTTVTIPAPQFSVRWAILATQDAEVLSTRRQHQVHSVVSSVYLTGTDADAGRSLVSAMVMTIATPYTDYSCSP